MALTTRVWGAGKLLLLGGALLLTYLLFAAASMRLALKTREVVVPSLTGRTVNEASALLADAGLTLKIEEGRRIDPKVPAGQIMTQEPESGVRTRRQRSVKVWISAGPRSLVIPSLVGESERAAQMRVQQNGLELRDGRRNPDRRTTRRDRSWRSRRRRRARALKWRCSSTGASAAPAT